MFACDGEAFEESLDPSCPGAFDSAEFDDEDSVALAQQLNTPPGGWQSSSVVRPDLYYSRLTLLHPSTADDCYRW